MFLTIVSKVWDPISKKKEIITFIVDSCIQIALDNGIGSQQTEYTANLFIGLLTKNQNIVCTKIFQRLLAVIMDERSLNTNKLDEISIYLRFILMISFNGGIDNKVLPEFCFIVSVLVGIGNPLMRSTLHGIFVNVVHSFLILQSDIKSETSLKSILFELSGSKVSMLFGLVGGVSPELGIKTKISNSTSINAFILFGEGSQQIGNTKFPLINLEEIPKILLQLINTRPKGTILLNCN